MKKILFGFAEDFKTCELFSEISKKLDVDFESYFLEKNFYEKNFYKKEKKRSFKYKFKLVSQIDMGYVLKNELEKVIEHALKKDRKLYKKDNSKYMLKLASHFFKFLDEMDKLYKFDIYFIQNENFFYESLMYYHAKKNNKEIIVFENGYFRPFTLMLDKNGVNFNSSIPQDKSFYDNIVVDERKLKSFLNKPFSDIQFQSKNYNKIYLKIIYGITELFNKENEFYRNPVENFVNKVKSVKRKKDNINYCNKSSDINLEIKGNKKYLFIPFQIETDSQITKYSKISTMKEFLDLVMETIEILNNSGENYYPLFKVHPLDTSIEFKQFKTYFDGHYKNKGELIFSGDTSKLIEKSDVVITINSTVGFEALLKKKKVIVLGDAFYNITGLSFYSEPDPKQLCEVIKKKDQLDYDLLKKFLYYLRFDYFIEINRNNLNETGVFNLCEKIKLLLKNDNLKRSMN